MRWREILAAAGLLAALARPALAEPRWLACKYNDSGKARTFLMVFDDLRNTASLLDGSTLVEGADTAITFQALRTRFPQFTITYNRNDGVLALTPVAGFGGILNGECRRSPPPPGAPNPT
jgi:hypothetical protein